MDALDFAIFRFMSPGGEARFWGSRRLIDPRITPREIAERVGVSVNGVRARLAALSTAGFLRGSEVWPNPSLFGVRLSTVEIPVTDASEAAVLLDDLALVDGVTFARDLLDEKDRKLRVSFVTDGTATSGRRMALLRRLAPRGLLREPVGYWVPPCEAELSPLDWRVLLALRKAPDDSLSRIAETVGVTLKTGARRFHRLLDQRACWWTHSERSEEFPLALVAAHVGTAAEREEVAGELPRLTESWMPVGADGMGVEPGARALPVVGLVPVGTPVQLERLVRRIAGLPGVNRVERTFALGSRGYPGWFDRRLEERTRPR
ncbi:MAG: winged helix-turn-helix domain-containing protein [Thermoplasmata archaeon]|nr:winged helix-turn-helix domain-containing protein [Thermoplasmata archaeon]